MIVNDLLTQLTRIFFILLALLTVADFIRHRDKARLDVALVFVSLTFSILVQIIMEITRMKAAWLNTIGVLGLAAQPYLLLRLVQYFRPVSGIIQKGALAGLIGSWVALIIFQNPPGLLLFLIIAYFVAIDGYAMSAFIRGAFSTAGVVRQRLRFAALGSGLVALVLLSVGVAYALPSLVGLLGPIVQCIAILCALAYYLGFAPPRWLRQAWQLTELRDYLVRSVRKPGDKPLVGVLDYLCLAVTQAIGNSTAGVVLWDRATERFVPLRTSGAAKPFSFPLSSEGEVEKVWRERVPAVIQRGDGKELALLESAGAESVFIVPLARNERAWGLLLVFLQHASLFVDDDLNLLLIFAQQSAIMLENDVVLEELHHYAEDLERKVGERTEEIQRLNAELEQRVIDRTAQLTAVNQELEAFSYSVSHDLRAPLRALDGMSQALVEDYGPQLDETARNYLQRIRAASQRMGQLIDDLLQLSRLTRSEMQCVQVNLSDVARQVVADLQDRQPDRHVEIVIEEGLMVNGDPRLLRVMLVNLLGNAWKFTEKQPQARIEFGVTQHQGQSAYFVRDNGAGFDMAYAEKLFGAFQRLHSDREFEGNGIGLATVQRVVYRHGGQIWAEGAVDKGATFYFTL